MAKNQIKIFFKKIYKKLKKARLKRAFVRVLHFSGKKPQGLCALHFALKRAFNNTAQGTSPQLYACMGGRAKRRRPNL